MAGDFPRRRVDQGHKSQSNYDEFNTWFCPNTNFSKYRVIAVLGVDTSLLKSQRQQTLKYAETQYTG